MLQFLTILLFTVVIDAGHGGKDPGAVGKRLQEKDINLEVSLLLGEQIRSNYPEVNVLYTREDDRFITLQGRADFVNKNKADLFICVHTNSAENKNSKGAETFILGTEKMDKNLSVAMRENSVITLESDYKTTYQGFDPNSIESYIMFELMQNQYLDNSLRFATLVQRQFSDRLQRADRGVRQAAFWVLLRSACPSVLVELGFVSNPEEEAYMATRNGKQQLAGAIYNAFTAYYRGARGEAKPTQEAKPVSEPAAVSEAKPVSEPAAVVETTTAIMAPKYAVQIAASRKVLSTNDPAFKGMKDVMMLKKGDIYKYYVFPADDINVVRLYRDKVKATFPDCFIITL